MFICVLIVDVIIKRFCVMHPSSIVCTSVGFVTTRDATSLIMFGVMNYSTVPMTVHIFGPSVPMTGRSVGMVRWVMNVINTSLV